MIEFVSLKIVSIIESLDFSESMIEKFVLIWKYSSQMVVIEKLEKKIN